MNCQVRHFSEATEEENKVAQVLLYGHRRLRRLLLKAFRAFKIIR